MAGKSWIKIAIDFDNVNLEKVYGVVYGLLHTTGTELSELDNKTSRLEIYISSGKTERDELEKKLSESLKNFSHSSKIEDIYYDPTNEQEWKKFFKTKKISKKIVIKPSWESYEEKPGEIVLTIDPGCAFGTGLHETTRGCLILIEQIATLLGNNTKMLDAGSGSGILGIAAHKLGIKTIHSIDNDHETIETCKSNFVVNNIEGKDSIIEITSLSSFDTKQKYDLITANIIPSVLIESMDVLYSSLKDDGHLVLSGILNKEELSVIRAFTKKLSLIKRIHLGEWCSLWLRKT